MDSTAESEGLDATLEKVVRPPSSPSSSSDYNTGDADDSSDSREPIPHSLKALENDFLINQDVTEEKVQEMIKNCKDMVLESAECSEERKWLVRRLIELRLRAQELREASGECMTLVLGHHLMPQKYQIKKSMPAYCDHCKTAIWTMLQSWCICENCGFCCHWRCMSRICRVCVHVIASEKGGYTYTKDICPERGLAKQKYRCAECNVKITFTNTKGLYLPCFGSTLIRHASIAETGYTEPRLCDYSGLYYCQRCHWNNVSVIPARVIRNWDIQPRPVCQAASQLLTLLYDRPVLVLEELNPKLFTLVPDLSLIKRLRDQLQMMKHYLVLCPEANKQGLPWKSGLRTHFLEHSSTYSIKDLVDLQNGILVDEINSVYDTMRNHITDYCDLCKARGHLCELCGNDEVIYPWDASAINCRQCSAVYHRICWIKRNHCCPRCLRLQQRRALQCEKLMDLRNSKTGNADVQINYNEIEANTDIS